MNEIEILNLLEQSEEELLSSLAKELIPGNEFISNPKELVTMSIDWLNAQKNNISGLVCSNEKIQEIQESISDDSKVELVTVIADLISGLLVNISPWTVSVIIVKNGLDWLCNE